MPVRKSLIAISWWSHPREHHSSYLSTWRQRSKQKTSCWTSVQILKWLSSSLVLWSTKNIDGGLSQLKKATICSTTGANSRRSFCQQMLQICGSSWYQLLRHNFQQYLTSLYWVLRDRTMFRRLDHRSILSLKIDYDRLWDIFKMWLKLNL